MKKAFDLEALTRPHINALTPYQPGEQPQGSDWVKLNTNENPYPASPKVAAAIAAEVGKLRLYPEPFSLKLREAIGQRHGLDAANVIIGNGSDDILNLITTAFAKDPGVGHTVPSYSLYPVVVGMADSRMIDVPFSREMKLYPQDIAAAEASVFFLTSPNAPTGVGFSRSTIRAVLEAIDGFLVVDEAYIDYGGETAIPLLQEFKNLIVVRTFSKSYGLAGLRVGFAVAVPEVISMLDRVRDVYNVDRLAQAGALAAFEDEHYFSERRADVISTRGRVAETFAKWGWFTYPSQTNFLFTEPRKPGSGPDAATALSLFEHLKRSRILIRYFPKHPLTCTFIRVSIGTDEQMDRFLQATEQWMQNV